MKSTPLLLSSALFIALTACASEKKKPEPVAAAPAPVMTQAKANLDSKSGSKVSGTIDFIETAQGLEVRYDLAGLKKGASHGMHFHENGDCGSKDAKSAGKHYIEVESTGGTALDSPQKHLGDLPEVIADADGKATGTFTVQDLTINKRNPVEGRAIIVHGGPDNPKRKAAPRIACGVVQTTSM